MNLNISVNKDQVYIRTEKPVNEGGYTFTLYRNDGSDFVGFDGEEKWRDLCLQTADCLLRNFIC